MEIITEFGGKNQLLRSDQGSLPGRYSVSLLRPDKEREKKWGAKHVTVWKLDEV